MFIIKFRANVDIYWLILIDASILFINCESTYSHDKWGEIFMSIISVWCSPQAVDYGRLSIEYRLTFINRSLPLAQRWNFVIVIVLSFPTTTISIDNDRLSCACLGIFQNYQLWTTSSVHLLHGQQYLKSILLISIDWPNDTVYLLNLHCSLHSRDFYLKGSFLRETLICRLLFIGRLILFAD